MAFLMLHTRYLEYNEQIQCNWGKKKYKLIHYNLILCVKFYIIVQVKILTGMQVPVILIIIK